MIPRLIQSLCLALAGFYLVLVSVATFCASSHDLHSSPIKHHSQNNISHSLLCAWACQVSSKANATDTTPEALLPFIFLLTGVLFPLVIIPTQAILIQISARGPPQ